MIFTPVSEVVPKPEPAKGGEVIEVAVVTVEVVGVAIANALGRRRQDGNAAARGLHAGEQALAAGSEGRKLEGGSEAGRGRCGRVRCVHGDGLWHGLRIGLMVHLTTD